MLQPAFYRKRKRIAMYAAANITILIDTVLLLVTAMLEQGMPLKDVCDNNRGPL
jgi:hypothetical protein